MLISIPKWYDWSVEALFRLSESFVISIPKWYDWSGTSVVTSTKIVPFQFLNGTIGVNGDVNFDAFLDQFQFLNGTIGVFAISRINDAQTVFQFLNGTIGVRASLVFD